MARRRLIDFLGWSLVVLSLFSCGAEHYLQKGDKNYAKAVQKGAVIIPEFKYITEFDTIINPITNEIEVIRTIIDSVPYPKEKVIYVPLSRQERLALKDSLKHLAKIKNYQIDSLKAELKTSVKINRQDNKQERKLNKCTWWSRLMAKFWWVLVIIGAVIGFYVRGFLPSIKNIFKK